MDYREPFKITKKMLDDPKYFDRMFTEWHNKQMKKDEWAEGENLILNSDFWLLDSLLKYSGIAYGLWPGPEDRVF